MSQQTIIGLIIIAIGAIGVIISGRLSSMYYDRESITTRMLEQIEGIGSRKIIPIWVSFINLASYGFIIYGIVKVIF